jgi:glycosyltransferase involved in cell wall biosynthesis
MQVKHSIVTICYNQEKYIAAALDSVLCESVKPYEIIIGDDCSTDGTRRIIEEYRGRYPEIIKLSLNEKNLGIFGNLNRTTPQVTGDMVHFLSGDDWFRPGLLEKMNRKMQELNLDPLKSRFILLPHCIIHHVDGSEVLIKNDAKRLEKFSPVGSLLREVTHTRLVGISRALFNMWPPFPEDSESIGPWADRLHDVLFAQHIDRQIVMDCEGAVYRAGVGITSKTKRQEMEKSYYRALLRVISICDCGELALSAIDRKYVDFHAKAYRLSFAYRFSGLWQTALSAFALAMSDLTETRIIARDLYFAHRRWVKNFSSRSSQSTPGKL